MLCIKRFLAVTLLSMLLINLQSSITGVSLAALYHRFLNSVYSKRPADTKSSEYRLCSHLCNTNGPYNPDPFKHYLYIHIAMHHTHES